MKQRLLGKAILVILLALAVVTPLAGCFEWHGDRDRDRGERYEGERHEEHRDNDRHDDEHGGERH